MTRAFSSSGVRAIAASGSHGGTKRTSGKAGPGGISRLAAQPPVAPRRRTQATVSAVAGRRREPLTEPWTSRDQPETQCRPHERGVAPEALVESMP